MDKLEKEMFFESWEWKDIRYRVLRRDKRTCLCCGSRRPPLQVDHIKPISKFPELKLDINNLQTLCRDCNQGKSNRYEDDFRKEKSAYARWSRQLEKFNRGAKVKKKRSKKKYKEKEPNLGIFGKSNNKKPKTILRKKNGK